MLVKYWIRMKSREICAAKWPNSFERIFTKSDEFDIQPSYSALVKLTAYVPDHGREAAYCAASLNFLLAVAAAAAAAAVAVLRDLRRGGSPR